MRPGICSTPAPGAHGAEQGAGDGAPFHGARGAGVAGEDREGERG